MICILAGNYDEAVRWASGQNLSKDEWFYPSDIEELKYKKDFHVMVVGTAGHNVPAAYFEKIYHIAKTRGRLK